MSITCENELRLCRNEITNIINMVRPYSMVPDEGVAFTIKSAVAAIEHNIAGDFVECGTWKGGCGLAMLLAQRIGFGEVLHKVHFFDSFEGLPPVDHRDGPAALQWQSQTNHNCRASLDELKETLRKFNFSSNDFTIWPGWFKDTLPGFIAAHDCVALLRLDADWYESTTLCLETLEPIVSEEAIVIVDDYYAWDGCARAVHDYLSKRNLSYRITSLVKNTGIYFVKQREKLS